MQMSVRLSVCLSVCLMKSVLELTIIIFFSQVSLRSVTGLSVLTSSDRRSLKYFVLLILTFAARLMYIT